MKIMNICGSILRARWLLGMPQHTVLRFRELYSAASLGIVEYQRIRDRYKNMNADTLGSFRKTMEEIAIDESNGNLVFTDDLKQMAHIVENDDDLKLFESLLTKFNKQNNKLRFSRFVFGPVIMRMYHYLNKPNEALCVYMNPEFDGLFDELSSHVVLMDLLFKNKMYKEVVDVYKSTREKQYSFGKYAKTIMVPLFGALYRLNTVESFEYTLALMQEIQEAGHVPLRRVICFGAALALRQNKPQIALDLISSIPNQGFILVRSIKALAACTLNQFDEVLVILASVLSLDTPTKNNHTFPQDVITFIEDCIQKSNRKDHIIEFKRIKEQLTHFNRISPETLDDLLCSEFTIYNPVNKMKNVVAASIDEAPHDPRKLLRISRPGLLEMP